MKSKKDLQIELNVSSATISNWIKTGFIAEPSNQVHYQHEEYLSILNSIKQGPAQKLNSRANRSNLNSTSASDGLIFKESTTALFTAIEKHNEHKSDIVTSLYSLSLIALEKKKLIGVNYLNGEVECNSKNVKNFFESWQIDCGNNLIEMINSFKEIDYPVEEKDFLGTFYQSIRTISSKSKDGAYYTPGQLLENIDVPTDTTVLDPCCGSGSILLSILSKNHNPEAVFGYDIDLMAVRICKVNLHLFFENIEFNPNIKVVDFIFEKRLQNENLFSKNDTIKFDYIITNPPWGSKFSLEQKKQLIETYPLIATTESFSIVLYNSLQFLAENGKAIFILPESFLSVLTHKGIRKYIKDFAKFEKIELFGNAFKGVMSKAIRVFISQSSETEKDLVLADIKKNTVNLLNQHLIKGPDFTIPFMTSSIDILIVKKINNKKSVFLKNNAIFALGIVTGNNDKHLKKAGEVNCEPIYRGQDIRKFIFSEPQLFIDFQSEDFQQIAPIKYYRENKIVYRFISDRIICALDTKKQLILNSANLFIPTLNYPLESIVCLFNSSLYTFYYRKIFNATKVLRNHIEALPLPEFSEDIHNQLNEFYHRATLNTIDWGGFNDFICSLFNLNEEEKNYIVKSF